MTAIVLAAHIVRAVDVYPLKFEVINSKEYIGFSGFKVKITNIGKKDLTYAIVTCIAYDSEGNEIDFDKHWVFASDVGGLKVGCSTYYTFYLDVPLPEVHSLGFQIDDIK